MDGPCTYRTVNVLPVLSKGEIDRDEAWRLRVAIGIYTIFSIYIFFAFLFVLNTILTFWHNTGMRAKLFFQSSGFDTIEPPHSDSI